jgi:hypothetical protein
MKFTYKINPTQQESFSKYLEESIQHFWTAPTGSFYLNAEGFEQVSRNYLDHSMEMCMEWFVRGASMECTYVAYVKHASWLTFVPWIAHQQRLLEITVPPPKGRKLAFVRPIKQEEDQTYLLRSDELTDGRTKLHAKRFWFFFFPSLVGLAIESQCRRRKCDNASNHPAAAGIIKSSWPDREGQPMIVLLCLEACFTSACCSSFRLLFLQRID